MTVADDFATSVQTFDTTGQAKFYDALTDLCRREGYRTHDDRGAVLAKCLIIGASYKTNIDRHLEQDETQDTRGRQGANTPGIRGLINSLHEGNVCVDGLIQQLDPIQEPMQLQDFEQTISVVSGFNSLIVEHMNLTNQGAQRDRQESNDIGSDIFSFCSKYLHCHKPCVVILDRFAVRGCTDIFRHVREEKADAGEAQPRWPSNGGAYGNHVRKFAAIYEHIQQTADEDIRQRLTVKLLDFHRFLMGGGHHA